MWCDVKCSVTRVYVCGVYVWRGLDVVFVKGLQWSRLARRWSNG